MTPDGETIPADDYNHVDIAKNIISQKHQKEYREKIMNDSSFDGDLYSFLYELGYIKVLTHKGFGEIISSIEPNQNQINNLVNIMNEYQPNILKVNIGSRGFQFNSSNLKYLGKFLRNENFELRESPISNIRNNPLFFSTANIKEAAFGHPYGYWIDPEGNKYDVDVGNHWVEGKGIIYEKFRQDPEDISVDVYKFLFDKGYVRIRCDDSSPYVESTREITGPQKKQILNIFKNYPFEKLKIGCPKDEIVKNYVQLFNLLIKGQKPVNMLNKLQNLPTFTPQEY